MRQPKLTTPSVAQRVIDSLKNCYQSVAATPRRNSDDRTFGYESLENRCVLSANPLGVEVVDGVPTDCGLVAAESVEDGSAGDNDSDANQQSTLTSITIRVNEELIRFNPYGGVLKLSAKDSFEVVNVEFESNAKQGVFAIEGYLNKIQDKYSASLIDYNDGRFSDIKENFTANGSNGSIPGLNGSWVAEEGWDRLSIALVHYTDNDTMVVSRSLIQLQVGEPDFAFDVKVLNRLQNAEIRVGEEFDIHGIWTNKGDGNFHNYAEVDIYHQSNLDEIVWVGALAGNASAGNEVAGHFVNKDINDGFSRVFRPDRPGVYLLRFYLDPEHVVSESNESNNRFDMKVKVLPANHAPVANADAVQTRMDETLDRIDVLANDWDPDADSLAISKVTQARHGKVEINADGTLSYTPDSGFVGKDRFRYRVTDGQAVSKFATVKVEVLPSGFILEPAAHGDEDSAIAIKVNADPNRYTHVLVSNIPDGAKLNHGKPAGDGSFQVKVKDLDSLTVTPPLNSDTQFELTLTPVHRKTVFVDLSESLTVTVNAVADGGQVDVADFIIVTGASGPLPFHFEFGDLDGSETHTVTFDGLPDFISLSAGEKMGTSWVLQYEDLAGLRILSERVSDTTDFRATDYGLFQRFDVSVAIRSVEQSNGNSFEAFDKFTFLAIQRIQPL